MKCLFGIIEPVNLVFLRLGSLKVLASLLGEENLMNIGQDTTAGNGDVAEELV